MKDFFEEMDPEFVNLVMDLDIENFDAVLKEMAQTWRKFHGGKFQLNYAARLVEEGKIIRLEVNNLSDNIKRIYDIEITDIVDGRPFVKKLELKNWNNFYPETIRSQFIKDLQKMEDLGDIQWIFNKTGTISDMQTLRTKVIAALKKADGSPVDGLNIITEQQIKRLFPIDARFVDKGNRIDFLLEKLNDDNVFNQIFEMVE